MASRKVTQPGLCDEEDIARKRAERERLIGGFTRLPLGEAAVFHDPALPPQVLPLIQSGLSDAAVRVADLIPPAVVIPPPQVFAYLSVKQLRSVSCVNGSAYGYYDGAIHLSANPGNDPAMVRETLIHEYTHHVLTTQGVRLPMWLSEGLAILIAQERWWRDPSLGLVEWISSHHLPFAELVPAFMHASDERYATHAYFQSLMMVRFVLDRSGTDGLRTLITRLSSGELHPDDAFAEGARLEGKGLESTWAQWTHAPHP